MTSTDLKEFSNAKTILIVEDEDLLREIESSILKSQGYKVLEAESARKAFDLWKARGDQIDLLLTDIILPNGITGVELAKRLLDGQPQLKVIFSTGRILCELDHNVLSRMNARFLAKPFLHEDLVHVVNDTLNMTDEGSVNESAG